MSDGYNIPFGIDLGDGLKKFDELIGRAEALRKANKEASEAIAQMNKEIASGAEAASKSIQEEARSAIAAKKAAEDRVRAEKIAVSVMDDLAKRQTENIKLNETQSKLIEKYTKNLDYTKKALAEATDPTQVMVLAKEMERLRDRIVKHYDDAAKAVTPLNNNLQETSNMIDKLSDSIMGSFSDSEMEKLGNSINNAATESEQLGVLIDFVSEKMEGMDSSSELFQNLTKDIEQANSMLGRNAEAADITTLSWDQLTDRLKYFQDALKGEGNPQEIVRINKEIENTQEQLKRVQNAGKEGFDELGNKLIPEAAEKVKSLNTELEETVQQLAKMRLEGKVDTKEYDDLIDRATEIRQAIKSVNDELEKTSSQTRGLDTLIETASLVTAGFNLAQGSMALFGVESEDLEKVTAKLAAGIAVLQGLQEIQVQLKNRESVANKALTATQAAYTVVVGTSTGALKAFRIALAATGIGLIVLAIGALVANWDKLTASMKLSSATTEKWGQTVDKIKAIAMGVGNAVLQWLINPIKTFYVLLTDGPKAAVESFINSMNVVKTYTEGFNSEIQRQNDAAHLKKLEAQKVALEKELEIRQAAGEKTIELERAIQSTALAIASATKEGQEDALQEFKVFEARVAKERADDAKKAADEAKKLRDKAAREGEKEVERIKEFNRRLVDMEADKQALIIAQIQDGASREKQEEELRYKQQLIALDRELEDFKGNHTDKTKLQSAQAKLREQLLDDHIVKMIGIDVKYFDELVKNQQEADRVLLEINNQNKDLELLEIDKRFEEILKAYREAYGTEIDLTQQKQRAIDEINTKYGLESIDKSESLAIARLEQTKIEGRNEEEVAKLREAMKLSILLDGANARLELLEKLGGEENKVEIENLKAFIASANREIESATKTSSKQKSLMEFLGFEMSEKESDMLVDSFTKTFDQIASAWETSLQRQIDAKQKQIDKLNDQISEVERELDRELSLQEQGYANNVDAKKKELEALQEQRDADIKQQEEIQKQQAKIQMAQVAMNNILQTSQMILAVANTYASDSKWGIVGIITATVAVAGMIASFIAMKNQINSTQSSVPKYRHGGTFLLDGPSHEQGGLGVYNEKTGQRVAEVEGGEGFFAINKDSKKYLPLMDAINRDDFGAVARFAGEFKDAVGVVDFSHVHEQTAKVVVIAQQQQEREQEYKEAMISIAGSESLQDIAISNRMMLEIERRRKTVTETKDYRIEQQGNIVRRIKKKKD
ncbi:hypothetical protein [Sphingobacterium sp. LRF_L2]|uniref:hypothetical protein n=1 Tax=Sphingobacterium sp. LRF_L2 TaxID=3369421 RepID=UPI003F60976E